MDNKTFFEYCYYGNDEIVNKYIDDGLDVNSKDKHNQTPLFWVDCLNYETVKRFLSLGSNPNAKDLDDFTVSMILTTGRWDEKKLEKLELLLSYGADIEVKDDEGNTFLDHCKDFKEEDKEKIKEMLEKYKVVNLKPAKE